MDSVLSYATAAVAIIGPLLVWFASDAKNKAKMGFVEERVKGIQLDIKDNYTNIKELSNRLTRSEKDREELHSRMDRIDESKASKEVVDMFKVDIGNLRTDINSRFDKIERILERK